MGATLGGLEVDSGITAVGRFEGDSLRLLTLDIAIDKWNDAILLNFMSAEIVYKGY